LPPLYKTICGAPAESTIYLVKDPDEQGNPENIDNVRYDDEDLFKFLASVRQEMGTTLARWEAALGLTTAPVP
jgi:hypothetical protein